jgi:ABC-type Fe3+/spermidine/putrescine transport system ATPase subunit
MRFEIRRLHDEFHITSIYVTHDQSEAMVIADRICVMNQGRIAQIGTPAEVYERPRTRFAASFIGKTNLREGTVNGGRSLDLGEGVALPIGAPLGDRTNGKMLICLRPHNIELVEREANVGGLTAAGYFHYPGTISQRFYFGDTIDYQVDLSARTKLRVIASATKSFPVGTRVKVLIHPSSCVPVQPD